MLDELVTYLPRVDDLLSLAAPQLDGILLRCIAQRATSTDPIAAKYVFEDEIVGLYPIGVMASFQNSTSANGALMEAWQRLLSAGLIMQAPGQAARMMTLTARGREAAGSVRFEEITVRQMLRREMLHSDLQGSVYENFAALCSNRHQQKEACTFLGPLAEGDWVSFCLHVVMAQHFLLSAAARTLSAAKIMLMSDREVDDVFLRLRWPETDGRPVCPGCGCEICYACPRPSGPSRWRCKACRKDFSVTSGTLFAWHKLPLRIYLLAIVIFCNEVKGHSMLAFCRDIDVQYKTAFVLAHKLREAMASSIKTLQIGGEGCTAEIDGAYFGGHVRPENLASDRIDRRLAENQSGQRQVVVVMRERDGRTLAQVFGAEEEALPAIRQRIVHGTTVHADESPAWNKLHASFPMKRVNHQVGFSVDGACTNGAESYFSRLRRGELGHHHHIAGAYLVRYAREAAWREDYRRVSNGDQANAIIHLAMRCKPSIDFCGYWQRARAA